MLFSESPQTFLERRGRRPTLRNPTPRMRTDNPIHSRTPGYPLPLPELSELETGAPPPDRVITRIWPHGAANA